MYDNFSGILIQLKLSTCNNTFSIQLFMKLAFFHNTPFDSFVKNKMTIAK